VEKDKKEVKVERKKKISKPDKSESFKSENNENENNLVFIDYNENSDDLSAKIDLDEKKKCGRR
jgi:hypothetical protein